MGKVVLNIKKPKGNDARTSAHIERTFMPGNADPTRTHLNRELINYPDGVTNRTQAIQYRIETAGIKRKIGKNQIRALQVLLSGSPEDMKRIQAEGRLEQWCKDSVDYLKEEFGEKNVVSAILHMDETTPHIHATVVPIVQGQRRKAEVEEDNGKKKYKKKAKDTVRLCADDVMTRKNLERFQDTYAQAMKKYGLERGIRGSEARNISTVEFYKEVYRKNIDLKENIVSLEKERQEVYEKTRDMYDRKDEARDKFLNMNEYVQKKKKDISLIESHIEKLKQEYEPLKTQDELNAIHEFFPMIKEQLQIAKLCEKVGLGVEYIRTLFNGGNLKGKSFAFFSPEHNRKFTAEDFRLKIEKESDDPNKLKLTLNGTNILDWFKLKYKELQEKIKPAHNKSRGFRM